MSVEVSTNKSIPRKLKSFINLPSRFHQNFLYWKSRMMGLPGGGGEKVFENMFTRFDRIHERERRTDRQIVSHRSTVWPFLCIASRGKNYNLDIL